MVGVSECGLYADVRSYSGKCYKLNIESLEYDVEICSKKGTKFLFLNNYIIFFRFQFLDNISTP